jgi:hypothetical protein
MFVPASDARPADWLVESITTFAKSVVSLVPDRFDSYVRIRHGPAADPRVGSLDAGVAAALAAILGSHTATPERCFFAVWEGFGGGYEFDVASSPMFALPHRRYYLVEGAVSTASSSVLPGFSSTSANLWWPADRAWCVATEIDLYSTYVGCGSAAATELVASPAYEAEAVDRTTGITFADDPYGI